MSGPKLSHSSVSNNDNVDSYELKHAQELLQQVSFDLLKMEKSLSQAIKRLLRIPYTTPTKCILNELGIQCIELEIISRRLMFLHRHVSSESESLCKNFLNEQCKLPGNTWIENTKRILQDLEINISLEEIATHSI